MLCPPGEKKSGLCREVVVSGGFTSSCLMRENLKLLQTGPTTKNEILQNATKKASYLNISGPFSLSVQTNNPC